MVSSSQRLRAPLGLGWSLFGFSARVGSFSRGGSRYYIILYMLSYIFHHYIILYMWLMIIPSFQEHILLVVWNIWIIFSIYWECHHPNWRIHIFQRGRYTTNQENMLKKTWGHFDHATAKMSWHFSNIFSYDDWWCWWWWWWELMVDDWWWCWCLARTNELTWAHQADSKRRTAIEITPFYNAILRWFKYCKGRYFKFGEK